MMNRAAHRICKWLQGKHEEKQHREGRMFFPNQNMDQPKKVIDQRNGRKIQVILCRLKDSLGFQPSLNRERTYRELQTRKKVYNNEFSQVKNIYIFIIPKDYRSFKLRFLFLLGTQIQQNGWKSKHPIQRSFFCSVHIIQDSILEAAVKNPNIACTTIKKIYPRLSIICLI